MTQSGRNRLAVPLVLSGIIILLALLVPVLPLPDPVRQNVAQRLASPGLAHWLGQDEYGRDVLSRILWGARVSLSVALSASTIAAVIGVFLGLVGGYFRGFVELVTVRAAEIVLCFPPLLLALMVVTLVGPGASTLILALSILYAPGFARVAYAETLSVRTLDYVAAQKSLGAPDWRILGLTLLPNIAAPLIVQFSLTVAAAMVLESGLSFLGLGVVPPAPSWGLMIRGARANMEVAPLLLLWPCLALCGTVLMLNFLCDRLRDVLDPRSGLAARPGFLRTVVGMPAAPEQTSNSSSLLTVSGLTLTLSTQGRSLDLVRDVSFTVDAGRTLAIVGESGSGKTLTALALMGLLPPDITARGHVLLHDRQNRQHALLALAEHDMRRLRGRDIAMVFQDPSTSLNPMVRVGVQIAEGLVAHGARGNLRERIIGLLGRVGLPDPKSRIDSYPHELSGGQKQRVMIAAAIANAPRLLIADEPTTALDVTVQAQILTLLQDLRRSQTGMGMIFVSHNLAVVGQIADEIVVMYAGEVVEQGPVAQVFATPRHPYTAALLASIPEETSDRLQSIPGSVPTPAAMPKGCRFAERCSMAQDTCRETRVALEVITDNRTSRCLRWRDMA